MLTVLTAHNSTILGDFILVTASFALLLVLIRLFAWKKITGIFEERERVIAGHLDAAENRLKAAKQLEDQRAAELAQSRVEGQALIQDAQERAKLEKKRLLEQADKDIQALHQKAQAEIAAEKREAQETLRIQVAELAVDLAGKLILDGLDQAAHQELIDRYLEKLGEK